jgi:succinate-semialdehyde dehydrogenase/glutarate-semialdehyde dehydrogenase
MPALVSHDASTGAVLGEVPETAPEAVAGVVAEVAAVQPFWAALPLGDRSRYLRRIAQVVLDEVDDLSELLAREQGRPRTEAVMMEILASVDALRWVAAYAPRFLADQRLRGNQLPLRGKRSHLVRDPVGVVGVASPWSSPWASGMRRVAFALMAGNGVVLVPDPLVPLTAVRLVRALERAGVPEGLVRVAAGRADLAAALERAGAGRVVRIGTAGQDPMLVLSDAQLRNAVSGALWAAFANAGQSRVNVARVYVRREVEDAFVDGLVAAVERLRLGDPRRWDVDLGPLTSAEHLPAVRDAVEAAVANGAEQLTGGAVELADAPGPFFAPVVLRGATPEMRVVREPVPGPVLPVVAVESEDEAIALANAVPSVGASVWTADRGRGERITRDLRAERAWINEHMLTALSPAGAAEFVDVRLRVWEPSRLRDLWWYPYDESLARTMKAATRYFYGRESERLRALREGVVPAARLLRRLARDTVRR